MKLNTAAKISFRVIALFVTAMLVSFVPDWLHEFFGDNLCTTGNIGESSLKETSSWGSTHYCEWGWTRGSYPHTAGIYHWGYRHWLFLVMCIILFIIQVIDIIQTFDKSL